MKPVEVSGAQDEPVHHGYVSGAQNEPVCHGDVSGPHGTRMNLRWKQKHAALPVGSVFQGLTPDIWGRVGG